MRSVALSHSPLFCLLFLASSALVALGCGASTPSGEGAQEATATASAESAEHATKGEAATPASAAPAAEDVAALPPGVSELREAGVVATFPAGWKVEAVRGGFIARAPGQTGAMALVGGVETDAINDVRHVLEKEAGVEFPIGLGQRTTNANGYTFFISLSDSARRDGTPVRTTTGLSAAAGAGTDTKPLVMLIWFRRDALETIQAAVKAIDTIDFAPRVKAERAKAPPP